MGKIWLAAFALLAGCAVLGIDDDEDGSGSPLALSSEALLIGTWVNTAATCEVAYIFKRAGEVVHGRTCNARDVQVTYGSYWADGDVLVVVPERSSCANFPTRHHVQRFVFDGPDRLILSTDTGLNTFVREADDDSMDAGNTSLRFGCYAPPGFAFEPMPIVPL